MPCAGSEIHDAAKILFGLETGDLLDGGQLALEGNDVGSILKLPAPTPSRLSSESLSETVSPSTPTLYRHPSQPFPAGKKRLYDAVLRESTSASSSPLRSGSTGFSTGSTNVSPGSTSPLPRTPAPFSSSLVHTSIPSSPGPSHAPRDGSQVQIEITTYKGNKYASLEEARQAKRHRSQVGYYRGRLNALIALRRPEEELAPIRKLLQYHEAAAPPRHYTRRLEVEEACRPKRYSKQRRRALAYPKWRQTCCARVSEARMRGRNTTQTSSACTPPLTQRRSRPQALEATHSLAEVVLLSLLDQDRLRSLLPRRLLNKLRYPCVVAVARTERMMRLASLLTGAFHDHRDFESCQTEACIYQTVDASHRITLHLICIEECRPRLT